MSYSRRSRYSRSPSPYKSYGRSISRSLSRSRSRSRSRDPSVENPGNNLYVTGLSTRVTRRDLEKHFSNEGKVEDVHLVIDPRTRESRGFAFVTMSTLKEADRCIKYLDQSALEGRIITVEKSKRRRGRRPTPGRYLGLRTIEERRGSRSYSSYSRSRYSSESDRSRSRSRSRSYSPYYYRRSHYSPYRRRGSRSRSYSRSRSPSYSRSPVRSRYYSPDVSRRRYMYASRDYSPDYYYYRRGSSRYRSVSRSDSRRHLRRSYSRSFSPRRSRSYSRSVSSVYSERSDSRSVSPYPRSRSRGRRYSRSLSRSPSVYSS